MVEIPRTKAVVLGISTITSISLSTDLNILSVILQILSKIRVFQQTLIIISE